MPAHPSLACLTLAGAALLSVLPAAAQSPAPAEGGIGWLPGSGRSHLGLTLGRSKYPSTCGITSLDCETSDTAVQVYAGTMLGDFWGAQLGYLDLGRVARGGGSTRAQGLTLSLFGRAPVGGAFGVFGKIGATYGQTETSSAVGSGVASGSENGFGLSYGAGVSYNFTPRLSAILAWDSHDFRFPGGSRDPVRATSLGLQYNY